MANAKKKWVKFTSTVKIPAEMAGKENDTEVQLGEPVHVPAFYADSVVQDGIADHCDAPKTKAAVKNPPKEKSADAAQQIETAEAAVSAAQVTLDGAEGTDDADDARAALLAAQQVLDGLKG
jgi:hypothetical protein